MTEPLSEQDQRELARAADYIGRTREEADRANRELERLEKTDDATLRTILYDRASPTFSRRNALVAIIGRVHLRRDDTLSRIVLPLWDDPDKELARMAIQYAPPSDPEMTTRLHALLDASQPHRWSEAASVLARWKDTTIIPRLLGWFLEGDQGHRNVAWSCLCFYGLLGPEECGACCVRHGTPVDAMMTTGRCWPSVCSG